jgi:hypothetical protein
MFFQKTLLSKAKRDKIPTKYPKNNNIIPKKSTENSNQTRKKLTLIEGASL